MITEAVAIDIWGCLARGEPLDRFSLPVKDGRVDLSGLVVPDPKVIERWQTAVAEVAKTESREVRGVRWQNIDFSGSRLRHLYVYSSEISNCKFDKCDLRALNPADTVFQNCSFRGANLQGSGLGTASVRGPRSGKRNSYLGTDFTAANLKGTIYTAAGFDSCIFDNAKLSDIDFARSTFKDCRFEGELREVQFWRARPWLPEEDVFPANEMLNVDFSRAKLHWVEFRGLTLDHVQLPSDPEHIVIDDFASVLDKLIAALKSKELDQTSKGLIAMLEVYRKWAPSHGRGVLNCRDLAENGEESLDRVLELLRQLGMGRNLNPRVN